MRGTFRHAADFVCSLLILLTACVPDAPRDNPLDPASPYFRNSGVLTGKVLSFYEPFLGIPDAQVTVLPSGPSTLSQSNGSFSFSDIVPGDISLLISKAGYASDTVRTTIVLAQNTNVQAHLNALPFVSSCVIVTRKVDQWWPGPSYSAVISSVVGDPDGQGDIASVLCTVDTASFPMTFVPEPPHYQVTINASSLPTKNLEWLAGKSLAIVVQDKPKGTTNGKSFAVSRIIQQTVIPISPTALDTAVSRPEFQWARPNASFPYSYKLELNRQDQGVPTLIWTQDNVDPLLTSFQYPDSLPPALYFWTIAIVDEYGNLSRSKEASFIVTGEPAP